VLVMVVERGATEQVLAALADRHFRPSASPLQ